MYNNIDTIHAIKVISEWLDGLSLHPKFPLNYPLAAINSAMITIMEITTLSLET